MSWRFKEESMVIAAVVLHSTHKLLHTKLSQSLISMNDTTDAKSTESSPMAYHVQLLRTCGLPIDLTQACDRN